MEYQPQTAVWEVTMGCNMRCGHCGSSCASALPDELSTEEAFGLIDECAGLGLRWITLSGGEPLTRKDLPQLVQRLHDRQITVNIITNGWLLGEEMVQTLKQSGISTVAISIDGTREVHDKIRMPGAFAHAEKAFSLLKKAGITCGAVTTVTRQNLDILPALREDLIRMGLDSWQMQIGLPMGNLSEHPDWVLAPEDVDRIIDFCYETSMEGRIRVFPADCIGYYNIREMEVRCRSFGVGHYAMWEGCNAGLRSFGILHNGDILGCTSIRDKEFIEGNIRVRPLKDIWTDPTAFQWRRKLKKEQLSGHCRSCKYGSKCLGGCPNTRLTMKGSIYAENEYCSYHVYQEKLRKALAERTDTDRLWQEAQDAVRRNQIQETAFLCEHVTELMPEHTEAWKMLGYAEFMCGNYANCRTANEKALELRPEDPYSLKGLGLALHRLGHTPEGIGYLERAARLTDYRDEDILHDLQVVKNELQHSDRC